MGHARALLSLPEEAAQRRIAREVVSRAVSVRETEAIVRRELAPRVDPPIEPPVPDPNTRAAEEKLRVALGTRVKIARKGKGGRIEIEFTNEAELNRIYDSLIGR
jgi:ParB family chromosome partitioning protein